MASKQRRRQDEAARLEAMTPEEITAAKSDRNAHDRARRARKKRLKHVLSNKWLSEQVGVSEETIRQWGLDGPRHLEARVRERIGDEEARMIFGERKRVAKELGKPASAG